ncbi:MAG: hypothetical protein K8R88_07120, partial [Armatimonadetes bacterium]|nr:hypothetical protein [Armatimonadota bacterium]
RSKHVQDVTMTVATLKSTLEIEKGVAVLSPSEGVRREDWIVRGIAAIVGPALMVYIAMARPFTTLDIGIPASGAWDAVGFCVGFFMLIVAIVGIRRSPWIFDSQKGTASHGRRVAFQLRDVHKVILRTNSDSGSQMSWTISVRIGVRNTRYLVDASDLTDAERLADELAGFLGVGVQKF